MKLRTLAARPLAFSLLMSSFPVAAIPACQSGTPHPSMDDAGNQNGGLDAGTTPQPDLADAPANEDLAHLQAPPDMAKAPTPADMAQVVVPPADMAQAVVPPADMAQVVVPPADMAQVVVPPADMAQGQQSSSFSVASLDPISGPLSSYVTINGAGFQSGDRVTLAGASVSAMSLKIVSATATAIVVALPSTLGTSTPAPVTLTVARTVNGADVSAPAKPFTVTGNRVFYIAPSGSNSAAGTLTAPLATMGGAAAKMQPGDVAYLRGGTYDGLVSIRQSGTASAPLTFRAYPEEKPIITNTKGQDDTVVLWGSYLVVDGIGMTNTVDSKKALNLPDGATNNVVSHCEIFGTRGQGMMLSGSNNLLYRNRIHDNGIHGKYDHGIYLQGKNNTLRSNWIYNNWAYGIQLYNGYGTISGGNVIEYNYIYHNGYGATSTGAMFNAGVIVALGQPNTVVRYNRFCDNQQWGVYVIDKLNGTQIIGNVTCYSDVGGLNPEGIGSGTVVDGNISFNDNKGYALATYPGVTSDHNTFWRSSGAPVLNWRYSSLSFSAYQTASGQDKDSQVANPGFKNVPTTGFNVADADKYDFCTKLRPELCDIP